MSTDTSDGAYRVYVVEDSVIMLRLLQEMLGGIRGAAVVGHSGRAEEAIQEIGKSSPNAITVDLALQTGTGYDVLKAVMREKTKSPVAIVLTNLTMAPNRERAAGLGASYFFDKSTEIAQMFRLVSRLVAEHQKQADASRNHG